MDATCPKMPSGKWRWFRHVWNLRVRSGENLKRACAVLAVAATSLTVLVSAPAAIANPIPAGTRASETLLAGETTQLFDSKSAATVVEQVSEEELNPSKTGQEATSSQETPDLAPEPGAQSQQSSDTQTPPAEPEQSGTVEQVAPESAPTTGDDTSQAGSQDSAQPSPLSAEAPAALAATSQQLASCAYANAGSGQYKDTLCWLDMAYYDESGAKKQITTEYREVLPRAEASCPFSNGRYTCTQTLKYQSIMGSDYGEQTFSATGSRSSNQNTARQSALTAATSEASKVLLNRNGTYFGSINNFPIEIQLEGGEYTFKALLDITAGNAANALAVTSSKFPTWSGAYLGNGAYVMPASIRELTWPAIYQIGGSSGSAGGTTTTATLKNIQLTQGQEGNLVGDFSVVVADAESTDNGESIAFTTSGGQGFQWLPNDPVAFASATTNATRKTAAVGRACNGTNANQWSSLTPPNAGSVTCTGPQGSAGSAGTAMLQAKAPASPSAAANFTVSQAMTGSGLQGVAFGFLMASAQVKVEVADRIITSDGAPSTGRFQAAFEVGGGAQVAANTGSSDLSATNRQSVPVGAAGTQVNFSASEPTEFSSSYTAAWSCVKTGGVNPETWPANGSTSAVPPAAGDAWFTLLPGYFIECTVKYTPPYLTLVKLVDQAGTQAANTADQWTLTASDAAGGATLSNSSAPGGSTAEATKRAVAITGEGAFYTLGEIGPDEGASPPMWRYGYDWTDISCVKNDGSTAFPAAAFTKTMTDGADNQVASATLKVAKGNDLTCTYTNKAREPRLVTQKVSSPESGTTVGENQEVTYQLIFDNSAGTARMLVSHADDLNDVLDDADFVEGSIRVGDGTETEYPSSQDSDVRGIWIDRMDTHVQALLISGEVPRGQTRTVWFKVKTLPNATNSEARQNAAAPLEGYSLRNYLKEIGKATPTSCSSPEEGEMPMCTEHPILAWKMTKTSQPLDGAALHVGGDLHYRMRIERINKKAEGTISGLVVSDDLTQTFRYARWFPQAPVPAPALQRGIYFYKADGSRYLLDDNDQYSYRLPSLQSAGAGGAASLTDVEAANAYVPAPVFTPNDVGQTCPETSGTGSPGPHDPDCFLGTWKLQTASFDLPSGAAYADVWFSVRVGFPYGTYDTASDDCTQIVWNNAESLAGSEMAANWQNYWKPYRQASTGQPFTNVAAASADGAKVGDEAVEVGLPLTCATEKVGTGGNFNPAGKTLYPSWNEATEDWSGPPTSTYPVWPKGFGNNDEDRLPNPVAPSKPAVGAAPALTSACTVSQKVDANYFVIRKDLLYTNSQGNLDRAINMVGHQLELRMNVPTSTDIPTTISGGENVPIENVCRKLTSGGDPAATYVYGVGAGARDCSNLGNGWEPLMCEAWDDPLGGTSGANEDGADTTCARFRPIANGAQAGRFRADRLPPATYFLTETKVPFAERTGPGSYNADSKTWNFPTNITKIPGAQLLPSAVEFKVTEDQGKMQVPLADGRAQPACQIPYGHDVSDLPTACINPTGFVMVLTNVTEPTLPFTGGQGLRFGLAAFGGGALLFGLAGTFWWRRQRLILATPKGADDAQAH